jgi:isocitrate dehydrogenase (NAD+)
MQRINKRNFVSMPSLPSLAPFRGTKYGGRFTVTLIPGDGIGNELAASVKTIFKEAEVPIDWEEFSVTGTKMSKENERAMQAAIDSLRRTTVGLKGILYTPVTRYGYRFGYLRFGFTH